jgi:hypothetical protein
VGLKKGQCWRVVCDDLLLMNLSCNPFNVNVMLQGIIIANSTYQNCGEYLNGICSQSSWNWHAFKNATFSTLKANISKLFVTFALMKKPRRYVCSHFFNPLTPLLKARFYLYLHTTARDFQSKWTMRPWYQSNIVRAPVSWVYYFHILKAVKGQ